MCYQVLILIVGSDNNECYWLGSSCIRFSINLLAHKALHIRFISSGLVCVSVKSYFVGQMVGADTYQGLVVIVVLKVKLSRWFRQITNIVIWSRCWAYYCLF